jgi:hypothetical protein
MPVLGRILRHGNSSIRASGAIRCLPFASDCSSRGTPVVEASSARRRSGALTGADRGRTSSDGPHPSNATWSGTVDELDATSSRRITSCALYDHRDNQWDRRCSHEPALRRHSPHAFFTRSNEAFTQDSVPVGESRSRNDKPVVHCSKRCW